MLTVDSVASRWSARRGSLAEEARARVVVRGHVQGVFFRDETRRRARSLGVAGWVANRPDGAVEAVFCLLALQHQFLPSNINFTASDDDFDLNIVANEARPAVLHRSTAPRIG